MSPGTANRTVVFSDLDGTLLDHDTYEWQAAAPALQALRERDIPVVLVSSKTLAELRDYRRQLQLVHPVVAENGAVIDIPDGYFDAAVDLRTTSASRQALQAAYLDACEVLNLDCEAFFELGIDGIMDATGLDREQARRANERQASEPILWRDGNAALRTFADAMQKRGLRCLQGGRFVHLMPDTDKARATEALVAAYRRHWGGAEVTSIALGDGPNDIEMLEAADIAVVIPARHSHAMALTSRNRIVHPAAEGPAGWNEAILSLLEQPETDRG